MNPEAAMRQALDGKLFWISEAGDYRCRNVGMDHIPDHQPRSYHLTREWTAAEDDQLRMLKSCKTGRYKMSKIMGRSERDLHLRMEALGILTTKGGKPR